MADEGVVRAMKSPRSWGAVARAFRGPSGRSPLGVSDLDKCAGYGA